MNVVWEEQFMPDKIGEFHEKIASKMNVPKWANVNCPYCNEELPISSIRTIGFKMNTRNFGDIIVEVMCDKCRRMDVVYFKNEISDIDDFCSFLKDVKQPSSEPIREDKMYEQNYNNLLEIAGIKIQKSGFVGESEKGG